MLVTQPVESLSLQFSSNLIENIDQKVPLAIHLTHFYKYAFQLNRFNES